MLLRVHAESSPQESAASTFMVETGSSSGTAFLIEPDLVVTAAHVVEGHSFVGLDPVGQLSGAEFGETLPSFVVYVNRDTDLAILRLLNPSQNTPLNLRDQLPEIGTAVSAIGVPGGIFGITDGQVLEFEQDLLVSDTEVAPGSSGGPLVDGSGDVVGVVVQYDLVTKNAISVPANEVTQFIESVPEVAWSRVPKTVDGPLVAAWFAAGFLLATMIIVIVIFVFAQRKKKRVRAKNLIRITIDKE